MKPSGNEADLFRPRPRWDLVSTAERAGRSDEELQRAEEEAKRECERAAASLAGSNHKNAMNEGVIIDDLVPKVRYEAGSQPGIRECSVPYPDNV